MARFEPYGGPKSERAYIDEFAEASVAPDAPGIATAYRTVDKTTAELAELRRDNARLRREAANHHAAAEAERVESARLRAQNLELTTQLNEARRNS
ncbi:hypothetical protein [Mycobacterium intracellulare]|uniref:hypothetical protein n=1 Tax=Mycobacterium intracellulare TaxID=1767 RepID=UPI001041E41D|nr:hypothetical protein [Mycobacterium intracellulare]